MSNPRPVPIPAPDDFFAACIAGAERAGLVLIGRATIASTEHAMRRNVLVSGTNVSTVLYLRHTTLFFSLPGSAFLLQAEYIEEQNPDYEAAHDGRVVALSRHPYWQLNLACGTLPGQWSGNDTWLYVAERFDETRFHVSNVPHMSQECVADKSHWIRMGFDSGTGVDMERDVCDGWYRSLLGYYPDVITPIEFEEAMRNMVGALRPYLREGPLLSRCRSASVIPLDVFPDCAESFVAQFPPERLLAVMEEIPHGLSSPANIAKMVDTANRVRAHE